MDPKDSGGLVGVVSNLVIEDFETVYRMHVASYLGNRCYVDIEKELEDGGRVHTQQEWVALSKKVPPAPLYFVVMDALHQNKDHSDQSQRVLVEKVRAMLATNFRRFGMMTSTRVRYASDGLDTVIHEFGYENQRQENAILVGPDGYVTGQSGFDGAMKTLVGIDDCTEVERVVEYVVGKKPCLWRFNTKQRYDIERALVLGDVNGGRFGIDAWDYNGRRARGMVAHVAENSP